MVTAIKRQLKVWYSDWFIMVLVILGCGVFGKVLFQIIALTDKEMMEHFPLATLLAAIGAVMFCGIMAAVQMPLSFNMEVSLGCTRKHFVGSFYAAMLVCSVICWAVVLVIGVIENAMNAAMYPTWKSEFDMLPYVIKWGLPVLAAVAVIGCFCGVLVMHFGKVAFWILWALWMIGCIGFPQISEAVEEAPDSMYGKLGAAVLGVVSKVPVSAWIVAGVTLVVVSVAGTWGFLRRQQVTS